MGSGSTLAFPAYNNWPHFYLREVPDTIVVYTGTGSGQGIKDVTLNNTDYGDSDAPLTSAQLQVFSLSLFPPPPDFLFIIRPLVTPQFIALLPQAGGDIQQLPILAAAVVQVYNLPGISTTRRSTGMDKRSYAPLIFDGNILSLGLLPRNIPHPKTKTKTKKKRAIIPFHGIPLYSMKHLFYTS